MTAAGLALAWLVSWAGAGAAWWASLHAAEPAAARLRLVALAYACASLFAAYCALGWGLALLFGG